MQSHFFQRDSRRRRSQRSRWLAAPWLLLWCVCLALAQPASALLWANGGHATAAQWISHVLLERLGIHDHHMAHAHQAAQTTQSRPRWGSIQPHQPVVVPPSSAPDTTAGAMDGLIVIWNWQNLPLAWAAPVSWNHPARCSITHAPSVPPPKPPSTSLGQAWTPVRGAEPCGLS